MRKPLDVMRPFSTLPAFAWLEEVRQGIPTSAVRTFLAKTGLDRDAFLRVMQISARTLERRAGAQLSPTQSDRFLRIKRIYDLAVEMIGNEERAQGWLQDRNRALRGQTPLEVLDSDVGADVVETILWRIADGIFS